MIGMERRRVQFFLGDLLEDALLEADVEASDREEDSENVEQMRSGRKVGWPSVKKMCMGAKSAFISTMARSATCARGR